MSTPGPKYLFLGSNLDDDRYVVRLLLEGLNTQARQWSEDLTILDNGSLPGLEFEVEQFKYLTHRKVSAWTRANIVFCFMDGLEHDRAIQAWLDQASWAGIPVFWISNYHRDKPPRENRTTTS